MTPANITALQALVQADPALAQQLQSAATASEISDAELEAVTGGSSSPSMDTPFLPTPQRDGQIEQVVR